MKIFLVTAWTKHSVDFACTEFSEEEMRRWTPCAVPLGSGMTIRVLSC